MEAHTNGQHYYNYCKWERKKHSPYDYERNGLLNKLLSHKIVESENHALQYLLNYIEKSFVILMKYTERMQNFKHYAYSNR